MAKELPTHCKNLDAVCAALGIRLPQQRPRALRIRDQVAAWTRGENVPAGIPVFPAKVKGYWPYLKVVEWGVAAGVTNVGKDKYELRPVAKPKMEDGRWKMEKKSKPSSILHPPSSPELSPQEKPASDEDLFAGMSPAEMRKNRIDFLRNIYLNPQLHPERKITKFEIDELRAEDPGLFERDTGSHSENITGGVRGVANYIRANYPGHGLAIHHKRILQWMKGEDLPKGCRENFPQYVDAGRYKTAEVKAWCDKYLIAAAVHQSLPFDPIAEEEAHERKRREQEAWEWEQERRADDRNYIRRDAVWGLITEFARAMFSRVDATERTLPKLFEEMVGKVLRNEEGRLKMENGKDLAAILHPLSSILVESYRAWLPGQNEALKREMEQAVAALESRSKEQG